MAKRKSSTRSKTRSDASAIGEPTLTGHSDSKIKLSVITSSCADTTISELLAELWTLRVYAVDFYARGCDILWAHEKDGMNRIQLEAESLLSRFAKGDIIDKLVQYVIGQKRRAVELVQNRYGEKVSPGTFRIPALATFFPEIISFNDEYAQQAADAIFNAARLAAKLQATVVEIVLGRAVERCHERPLNVNTPRIRCDYVYKSTHEERLDRAVDVLVEVAKRMKSSEEVKGIKLAAEIEPGYSFVLNNRRRVDYFLGKLVEKGVADVVGLNLDFGHILILSHTDNEDERIRPRDVEGLIPQIFHAHVSDNVGFHFRDLVPGTFHHLGTKDEGMHERTFREWIEVCVRCSLDNPSFTRHLAVELEACSRIQWVQRSLLRLGYIIREVLGE